ncbi:histidine phosphatase family protein [Halomonas sp. AOP27-A1-41]|uniref:histidine phosphatase family protein n=1 Tax=Halomonas sp. AOP27-A1-41 TaxID=3457707 RepID=UPI004033DF1A
MSNTFLAASYHWRNRYLLMRHGHSQANQQALIISSPGRGVEAFGLSTIGEQQLASAVHAWAWPVPTQVVHSDFLRTTQTAARVAEAFKLTMTPDKRLRERSFGEWEGGSDERYPDVWALDAQNADHTTHQVEAVSAVAARMMTVIEEREQQCEGETILVVSHGDPLQILLTALQDRPLTQHREQPALLPASITQVGAP